MTTSGTASFSYNRDQIIRAAYRKVGAIAAGEIPSAQMTLDGSDALNAMVKEWEASGIHVWTETEGILFLQPSQIQYQLGPNSPDHAAISYNTTTLGFAAANGASTIQVAAITNMLSGDQIGVVLDSGVIFWTTINGAPSGTTVTLTTPLTDSAQAQNFVYNYTNNINTAITVKPLRVPFARRYNYASAIDTPMLPLSRKDYYDLPNKQNTGIVTQFYYNSQLSVGYMNVWPAPIDATNGLKFTWYRPIQDFDEAGDTPDLPTEWVSTLVFNLAVEMAPEFGVPLEVYQMIKTAAMEKLDKLSGWDREDTPAYFGVDFTMMGYGG